MSGAESTCTTRRDPCCEEHTICTAVAPDAVRTVPTYATDAGFGPQLVRNSNPVRSLQASEPGKPLAEPRSNEPSQALDGSIHKLSSRAARGEVPDDTDVGEPLVDLDDLADDQ